MAKRGYRGKAPHNDMKVSNPPSGQKHNPRLKSEYNKLPRKQKYSYIRTNYFFPQGSMTISGTLDLVAASTITMSATDGTVLQIKGVAGATNTGATPAVFKANGTDAEAAAGIVACVNANMAGLITASSTSEVVTLTQEHPGPDGNSTLNVGSGTVVETVAFNGTGANSSGSGFLFTGG